ncbi:MAG: AEC family transporter [Candidatus Mcinerneyibacterium aminivorans]|uniref:AEC family transporter n=1 Tax=Candidatus Mcinerneyibacterium aminivorans TaxID=2703815 RepID=A0A5D0MH47_9BACT|nr:MAG: AEC family transporter [Candidatus Mcinerneyibacterium aminivorans]
MKIFLTILAIMLPIFYGYFFKKINVFSQSEIDTLRKFVVRVTVPFIIVRNLYSANMETLNQIFPSITSFITVTIIFSFTGLFLSKYFTKTDKERNSYIFSVFVGNYGFLGWGVMAYFYGDAGFTRAVFFSLLFWPVFLSSGFLLAYLRNKGESKYNKSSSFKKLLLKNASVPITAALFAISLNLGEIEIPKLLWNFIDKFASITIPMILFTIGLNFKFRMKMNKFKIILAGTFHRLIFGFAIGIATLFLVKSFFSIDPINQKVILIEAAMPTAAMTPFFAEYVNMDKKLQSGIITFSTIFSLITIPLWYYLVENIIV